MINLSTYPTKLDVPFFQQTRYSTCGPAAIMMVMKYWDKSFVLSRFVEFKIWLRSNPFILFGGTLQFGLAKTALKMGFKVRIYQKTRILEYNSAYTRFLSFWEYLFSRGHYGSKNPIKYDKEILDVVNDALINGIPPIVFVNLEPVIGENVLHWLVVTGVDEQYIYVNDPYVSLGFMSKIKKGHPIELKIFKKAIATDSVGNLHLPPCAILIYK